MGYFLFLPKKNLIRLWSVALLLFLYAIWSTSINFRVVQKLLDNFFQKLDNSEVNRQFILPPSFKDIENKEGNQIGFPVSQIPPPRFCVERWASSLFIDIVSKFHMHLHNLSKK